MVEDSVARRSGGAGSFRGFVFEFRWLTDHAHAPDASCARGVPEEAAEDPMRVVIASILLLLVIVSVARAECAWVLWLGIGTTYTAFGAYGANAGERECKEASTQLMTDMRKDAKQLGEFLKSSSRYLCLPDTVDPRGPKEKGAK